MRVSLPESMPFADLYPNEPLPDMDMKDSETVFQTIITEPEEWIDAGAKDGDSSTEVNRLQCALGSFIFASEYGYIAAAGVCGVNVPHRKSRDISDPWKCSVPGTLGEFRYS